MKTIDTRDLCTRQQELQDLKAAVENAQESLTEAQDELEQVSTSKPAEDESALTELEEWETALQDAQNAVDEAEADHRRALDDFGDDEQTELAELDELESEISEWRHGETLIPESDFEDYARQLADDIGAVPDESRWPCACIDWEWAARELAMDYSTVTYQGTDYLVRS